MARSLGKITQVQVRAEVSLDRLERGVTEIEPDLAERWSTATSTGAPCPLVVRGRQGHLDGTAYDASWSGAASRSPGRLTRRGRSPRPPRPCADVPRASRFGPAAVHQAPPASGSESGENAPGVRQRGHESAGVSERP
jgi:hypothetical protein